jgi:hypothetical protein
VGAKYLDIELIVAEEEATDAEFLIPIVNDVSYDQRVLYDLRSGSLPNELKHCSITTIIIIIIIFIYRALFS